MHLAPQEGLAPEFRRLHAGGRAEPKQLRKKLAGNAVVPQERGALLLGHPRILGGSGVRATNAVAEEARAPKEEGEPAARRARGSCLKGFASAAGRSGTAGAGVIAPAGFAACSNASAFAAKMHEQEPQRLCGVLERGGGGGLSSDEELVTTSQLQPHVSEFAEEPDLEEPPRNFKVTFRYSQTGCSGASTAALALPVPDEAATLRSKIWGMGRRAAQERREAAAAIRELKASSKQHAHIVSHTLLTTQAQAKHLEREGARLTSNFKYFRKRTYELENEVGQLRAKLKSAREEADRSSRLARESEILVRRKDQLLHKNIERRVSAESAYKHRAASIKQAQSEAVFSEKAAAAAQESLSAQSEQLQLVRLDHEALSGKHAEQMEANTQLAERVLELESQVQTAQQESERASRAAEQAEADGSTLATLTQDLVDKLVQTQAEFQQLQDEVASFQPPKYVDVNEVAERTKRRAVHADLEYLHAALTARPWRACDLVTALQRSNHLEAVLNTREVHCSPLPLSVL